MSEKQQFERMADYNAWMNAKVYAAASRMRPSDLHAEKGAFFGSVFATLNHILVADTIWLKRFAGHPTGFSSLTTMTSHPTPASLGGLLHADFEALGDARKAMDRLIRDFCNEARDADYRVSLAYSNMAGQAFVEDFAALVQHFFNHQTHHRGQVTTLLSQAGIDVGATDLVVMLREDAPA